MYNYANSQEFFEQIQIQDTQRNAHVVTMPDGGALYAIPSDIAGKPINFIRYNSIGRITWRRSINFVAFNKVSSLKLHKSSQGNRIIIGGSDNAGGGLFVSLSETNNLQNPITVNFAKRIPIGTNPISGISFLILRSDNYLIVTAESASRDIHFRIINFNGTGTEPNFNGRFQTPTNNSGIYTYDLVEHPSNDGLVYFCGAIYNTNNCHNGFIGAINTTNATLNNMAPGTMFISHAPLTYNGNSNSSIDRLLIYRDNNALFNILAVGGVGTIGNGATANLTLQSFPSSFNHTNFPMNNKLVRIISLGNNINTGNDGIRYNLSLFQRSLTPNDQLIYLSGHSDEKPFIASINPNGMVLDNISYIKSSIQANTKRAAYFDFIDATRVWIGCPITNDDMLTGIAYLDEDTLCKGNLTPTSMNQLVSYTRLFDAGSANLNSSVTLTPVITIPTITTQNICGGKNSCSAKISYTKRGCNNFTFNLSTLGVLPPLCNVWKVNEVVSQNGGNSLVRTLGIGSHKICVSYFGISSADSNQICCNEICIDIIVNTPIVKPPMNLEVCPEQGIQCWISPCDSPFSLNKKDFSYYELTGNGYFWNSRTSVYNGTITGCIAHSLIVGTYNINYYDKDGCLLWSQTINVQRKCLALPEAPPNRFDIQDVLFDPNPNPTNGATEISYQLSQEYSNAFITIMGLDGKEIVSYKLSALKGKSSINADLSKLASGTYLYTLVAGERVIDSKRLQVNK